MLETCPVLRLYENARCVRPSITRCEHKAAICKGANHASVSKGAHHWQYVPLNLLECQPCIELMVPAQEHS
jgi:hypothetical protein